MSVDLFGISLTVVYTGTPEMLADRQLPLWWGRAIQSAFLQAVRQADPELADELHRENTQHPYTVSGLLGWRKGTVPTSEMSFHIRLTGLTARVNDILQCLTGAGGIFSIGQTIMLDYLPFRITGSAPDVDGGRIYSDLIATGLTRSEVNVLDFRFRSPTLFKSKDKTQPLPLPELVFRSLSERWNTFAPVMFPEELLRYTEECLAISAFNLKSLPVPLKEGVLRIGSVGHVRFRALNADRYWLSLCHTLSLFAGYAGVGSGTGYGLGQVEVLPPKKKEETA